MKHRHSSPRRSPALARALVAFFATVVLALIASAAVLWPDAATNAADGLALVPTGLEQLGLSLFD